MTLHNIYHCIYQDVAVAEISPSLFLTIFLIKDIQLGVIRLVLVLVLVLLVVEVVEVVEVEE